MFLSLSVIKNNNSRMRDGFFITFISFPKSIFLSIVGFIFIAENTYIYIYIERERGRLNFKQKGEKRFENEVCL